MPISDLEFTIFYRLKQTWPKTKTWMEAEDQRRTTARDLVAHLEEAGWTFKPPTPTPPHSAP